MRGLQKPRSRREKARACCPSPSSVGGCDGHPGVRVVYSPRYQIDIGAHVFPTSKYRLVHARLLEAGVLHLSDVVDPKPGSWDDLPLGHTSGYLASIRDGGLTAQDLGNLQLPWSVDIVEGFRTMVGGTVQAARMACGLDRPA